LSLLVDEDKQPAAAWAGQGSSMGRRADEHNITHVQHLHHWPAPHIHQTALYLLLPAASCLTRRLPRSGQPCGPAAQEWIHTAQRVSCARTQRHPGCKACMAQIQCQHLLG
jgi:hypothetical protein